MKDIKNFILESSNKLEDKIKKYLNDFMPNPDSWSKKEWKTFINDLIKDDFDYGALNEMFEDFYIDEDIDEIDFDDPKIKQILIDYAKEEKSSNYNNWDIANTY